MFARSKALHMFNLDIVHLSYLWTTEHCVEIGVMYTAPCSLSFSLFFIIPPLQKVSGQQIFERSIKEFFFGICCSHPWLRGNKLKRSKSMDPNAFCHKFIFILYLFLRDRPIFYFQKVFIFIVHQIFVFSAKLTQS